MNWETIELHSVCRPRQWPTIPKTKLTETGYPVYGANGTIGFYTEFNHEFPTVLITCRGATCGTINVCTPMSYVTGNAMALDELDESQVSIEFLTHYLKAYDFRPIITGVAQPQITGQSLKRVKIPLPPLAEQKRIAGILDAADTLRTKRRQSIEQLDSLIQSTFLKMFGDPVTNPMGWEKTSLGEHSLLTGGYAFKSSDYSDHGIPLIRIGEVNRKEFNSDTLPKLPPEQATKLERFLVKNGDLLLSLTGTVGKDDYGHIVRVQGDSDQYFLNQRVARITPLNRLHESYLIFFLANTGIRGILTSQCRGVRQANINNRDIQSLPLPLPPLAHQQQFAAIVEKIEAQKSRYRSQLAELDTLFLSLQSRAFKGEL